MLLQESVYDGRSLLLHIIPGILFGLYLASTIHCLRWLLFDDNGWRIRKNISWGMLFVTILVFLLSTIYMGYTALQIIGWYSPGLPDAVYIPFCYLAGHAYLPIILLTDGILIYRCWVVFAKSWLIIILPIALWCLCTLSTIFNFICNIGDLELIGIHWYHCPAAFFSLPPPDLLFYSGNIVISTYTTLAIVCRIILVARATRTHVTRLHRVCRILGESGFLYTFTSGLYLSSLIIYYYYYLRTVDPTQPSTDDYLEVRVYSDINSMLVYFMPGIAFNLILIRVGEGRTTEGDR